MTDNAANMAKMRQELENDENRKLISYGCAAHILNLLAHDIVEEFQSCKEKII